MQSEQRVRLQAEKLEAVVREVSQDPSEWEKKLEEDAKKKVA